MIFYAFKILNLCSLLHLTGFERGLGPSAEIRLPNLHYLLSPNLHITLKCAKILNMLNNTHESSVSSIKMGHLTWSEAIS